MNVFKQKSARMDATTHKKMYRSGKLWLFAGITLMGMVGGVGATNVTVTPSVVYASEEAPTPEEQVEEIIVIVTTIQATHDDLDNMSNENLDDMLNMLNYLKQNPEMVPVEKIGIVAGMMPGYTNANAAMLQQMITAAAGFVGTLTSGTGYDAEKDYTGNPDPVVDPLADAKTAAQDALAAATTPVSNEDAVKNAKATLQTAIDAATDADTLNAAVTTYSDTVDQAKADRKVAEAEGDSAVAAAKAAGVADKLAVTKAIDAFNQAAADAANETATTAQVKDAAGFINDVVAAEQALDASIAPVSQEPATQDAKDKYQAAIEVATTAADLQNAKTVYDAAIQDVKDSRNVAITAGDAAVQAAQNAKVADKDTVKTAIDAYNAVVEKAGHDNATSADITAAADHVNSVVGAQNALDAATAAGVDNESDVIDAINKLSDLLKDPTATDNAVTDATTTLNNVVVAADEERKNTLSPADLDVKAYQHEQVGGDGSPTLLQEKAALVAKQQAAADATNPDHAAATTEAIKTAYDQLEKDLAAKQAERKLVTDEGDAIVDANQNAVGALAEAINAYKNAVADATAGNSTTAAISTAVAQLKEIQKIDNDINDAVTNAAKPYGEEPEVKTALDKVKTLDEKASTAAKQKALDDLTKAIEDAKKPRQDAKDDAKVATEAVTGGVATNPEVEAAKQAVEEAVAQADANNGSTAGITDAINKLNEAVAKAENQNQAIDDAETTASPYSKEPDVAAALEKIKTLDDTTPTADKQAALDDLTKAIKDAENPRQGAKDDAKVATEAVTGGVAENPEVEAAKAAVKEAVDQADANNGTTAGITDAINKLNEAVAKVEKQNQAIDNAETTASPYSKEPEVKAALDKIATLDDTTSTADKQAALDDLTKAIENAEKLRGEVEGEATTATTTVPEGVADNPEVKAAKAAVEEAIKQADADNGTTAGIADAINKLNEAVAKVEKQNQAIDNAETTASPYSKEPEVKAALDKIATLDDTTPTADKQAALDNLTKAIEDAEKLRGEVEGKATTATTIVLEGVADNPEVEAAKQAVEEAIKQADANNGTTAGITDAINKLNEAVAKVEKQNQAIDNAETTASPYSKEPEVKAALDKIATLDDTTPTADKQAALDNLTKAIEDAEKLRGEVEGKATTATTTVPGGVAENPEVEAAKQAVEEAINQADANNGTTAGITDAINKLNEAVAKAENQNQAIDNAETTASPYSKEPEVKAALDKIATLDDTTPTADKQAALDDLTKAIKDAENPRQGAKDDAKVATEAVTGGVAENPEVKAAKAAVERAIAQADANKGTSAEINNTVKTLEDAIKTVENVDAALEAATAATNPYGVEPAVKAALDKVDQLGDTTPTAERQAALDDLTKAIEDAKQPREDAKNAATEAKTTVPAGVATNPEVEAAKQAVEEAVDQAAANNGTTAGINEAITALKEAVAAADTANTAADSALAQETTPVDNEQAVTDAKQDFQDILRDKTTSTTAITAAVEAYNQAVNAAKEERASAIESGDAIVASATPAGVAQDTDVVAAIAAYTAVVAGANGQAKTTAEVEAAAQNVQVAIDAATAARTSTVVTTPYSLETGVAKAKQVLAGLLTDPTTSTKAIQQATADLQQAVATAETNRTNTINEGEMITASAPALAMAYRQDVALAIAAYQGAVTRAAEDADVTKTIQDALDNLKAALAKIQAAIDAAKATTTGEVGQEPEVAAAKQHLADLITPKSSATADEISAATTTLQAVIESATTERGDVVEAGDTVIDDVAASGHDVNEEIANAIKDYQDAKASAATGMPDAATSAKLTEATKNLMAVTETLNKAIDTAKAVVSAPFAQDAAVAATEEALADLLSDKSSSAAAITTATEALTTAIAEAKPARAKANAEGDTATAKAADAGLTQEATVAQAIAHFEEVQAKAAANKASTEAVQAAADTLNAEITEAAQARAAVVEKGDATQTTAKAQAVAQEAAVVAAINAYGATKAAANAGKATTADIAAAVKTLEATIAQAKADRATVIVAGDAVEKTAKTGAQTHAVVNAIAVYEASKAAAATGKATTADIQAAAKVLESALADNTVGRRQLPDTGVATSEAVGPETPTTGAMPTVVDSTENNLPQTGENTSVVGVIGMAVTSLFAVLGLAKKRRENEE